MALDFTGGDTDRVNIGSGSDIDNLHTGSQLWLVYLDATTGTTVLFSKFNDSEAGKIFQIVNGNANFKMAGSTGDAERNNNTTLATGKWVWLAATWDGITNTPDMYYAPNIEDKLALDNGSSNAGSGTAVDEASFSAIIGTYGFGSTPTIESLSVNGRIARFMYFDAKLTLAQLISEQFHPDQRGNCKDWHEFGLYLPSTGNQLDLSGHGNTGTVTGATLIAHAPISIPKFDRFTIPQIPASAVTFNASAVALTISIPAPVLQQTVNAVAVGLTITPVAAVFQQTFRASAVVINMAIATPTFTQVLQASAVAMNISIPAATTFLGNTFVASAVALTITPPTATFKQALNASPVQLSLAAPSASYQQAVSASAVTLVLTVVAATFTTPVGAFVLIRDIISLGDQRSLSSLEDLRDIDSLGDQRRLDRG